MFSAGIVPSLLNRIVNHAFLFNSQVITVKYFLFKKILTADMHAFLEQRKFVSLQVEYKPTCYSSSRCLSTCPIFCTGINADIVGRWRE